METTEEVNQIENVADKPRDRHISITVETDELWKKQYPRTPKSDIDDCVAITDDSGFGSPYRSPKKDFETEVYPGKKVKWTIANQNVSRIVVMLHSVSHNPTKGNPYYFDHNPLNVGKDGSVEGTIMNLGNLPDDNYTINFILKNLDTDEKRTYPIDPKLKIRPQL